MENNTNPTPSPEDRKWSELAAQVAAPSAARFALSEAAAYQDPANGVPTSTDRLLELTHAVAAAEAVAALAWAVQDEMTEGNNRDLRRAVAAVAERESLRLLTVGPDDRWSGRGNDLRRVVFDAQREWVADAARWAEYVGRAR